MWLVHCSILLGVSAPFAVALSTTLLIVQLAEPELLVLLFLPVQVPNAHHCYEANPALYGGAVLAAANT